MLLNVDRGLFDVGSGMNQKDQVRHIIMALDGRDFSTDDLPKVNHINSMLAKLEAAGEIERTGKLKPAPKGSIGTRQRVLWRVIELKLSQEVKSEPDTKLIAWHSVFKEFFTVPKMRGEVRIINKFSEPSVGIV